MLLVDLRFVQHGQIRRHQVPNLVALPLGFEAITHLVPLLTWVVATADGG